MKKIIVFTQSIIDYPYYALFRIFKKAQIGLPNLQQHTTAVIFIFVLFIYYLWLKDIPFFNRFNIETIIVFLAYTIYILIVGFGNRYLTIEVRYANVSNANKILLSIYAFLFFLCAFCALIKLNVVHIF